MGVAYLRPDRGLPGYLRRRDLGSAMARAPAPGRGAAAAVLGFVRLQTEKLGVDEPLGVGLNALATMGVLVALVLVLSQRLSTADAERARAETAVAVALERFRSLLEATPDPMFVIDPAGRMALVNLTAEESLGYDAGELVGQPVEVLLPDRVRAAHVGHRAEFAAAPGVRRMGRGRELFARRKDGSEMPVEISVSPLETEAGAFAIVALRDATARKVADAARREAEERFTRRSTRPPIGMALVEPSGRFLRVNQALCELTGQTVEVLTATTPPSIIHADDREADAAAEQRLLAGEVKRLRAEERYLTAAGEVVPVEVSVTLIRDGRGEPSHFVTQVVDVSERTRHASELRFLADHDPLTGLFNRRRFEHELAREHAGAGRYGAAGALLALDLDHFKHVNDSLGHAAGDKLIMRVAMALRRRLRETDVLARLGGDEFAIALPHIDGEAEAVLVAEQLLAAVRDECPPVAGRRVTGSIGVAMFAGADGVTPQELAVEADIAMYDAKEDGGDRVAVFDAAHGRRESLDQRLTWADRIHRALENDEFVLQAQPIVALEGDDRRQYELLIRMRGEGGELILPGAFLDVTERFGLIGAIDQWVVTEAIRMLGEHQPPAATCGSRSTSQASRSRTAR